LAGGHRDDLEVVVDCLEESLGPLPDENIGMIHDGVDKR